MSLVFPSSLAAPDIAAVAPAMRKTRPDPPIGGDTVPTFVWTAMSGRGERRLALVLILCSTLAFAIALPFATVPLAQVPGFIPAHQAALVATELVTALLLFGQFSQARAPSLLALACGYLYGALIIIPHLLSYPGVFLAGGLPGQTGQTTAWLYMFWHGGFPLFVIAYAVLRTREGRSAAWETSTPMAGAAVLAVVLLVLLLILLSTSLSPVLPAIMDGHVVRTKLFAWAVWAISLVALVVLWRKPSHSALDLWLMVVMVAWMLDVALGAIFISARFDLGFYAARAYGLVAATFVLATLIIETGRLYTRLALASARLADDAQLLERRVRERTQELLDLNREQQAIVAASPVAIYMIDDKGRVALWNASAERVFGYTAEETIGKLPPFLLDEHVAGFRAHLIRVSVGASGSSSRAGSLEAKRRRADGKLIDVVDRWVRVEGERGGLVGIMFAAADVTEQKKVEGQLRQSQKMEAIGNLTGGMAHDFNNLLGVVIGNLDLVLDSGDPVPSDAEPLLRDAQDAALRGADLTRRLLAFARRQTLDPRRVQVNELIEGIAKLLSRTLGEEIEIVLNIDPDIWPVVVDPAQLESSLTNLSTNARDAMPGGGKLSVTTGNRVLDEDYAAQHVDVRPGEYAMIEVTDSGSGMTAEVMSQIFEPFYTTKELGKGTGLGLSMVFGFMKQSGGHINVYSEVGIGTTFRLYLPRAAAEAEAAEEAPDLVTPGGSETVLAVEDNASLRRVAVRQLTQLGYRVVEAADAHEAIAVLEREPVDLLFTDVVMPGGVSGYELASTAAARWPAIKVVLTSGFPDNRLDGKPSNIRVLSKPYRKLDLARVVREALDDREKP